MRKLAGFAWLAVVISALALSNWSLLFVGHHYGLPVILAALLSVSLDGAALVAADISLRHAREHGSSGTSARAAVFTCAGISAWLNSEHAAMLREQFPAHVMFAAPPVIALVLFELHTRWERRDALRAAGRLAEPLPVFGAFTWLLHPLAVFLAVRRVTLARLNAKTAAEFRRVALTTPEVVKPAKPDDSVTTRLARMTEQDQAAMTALTANPDMTFPELAEALGVSERTARRVRARLNGHAPLSMAGRS